MKKVSKGLIKALKSNIALDKRNLKKHKLEYFKLTRKHTSSGGKAKGGAYEHKIASLIIKAFKKLGFTEADCYRTKNSGAGKQKGDIQLSSALAKLLPYTFECKHYKGGHLLYHMLYSVEKMQKSWPWHKWWEQLEEECKVSKKPGLLIWRENDGEDLVSFWVKDFNKEIDFISLKCLLITTYKDELAIWTMKFKDFLKVMVHRSRRKNDRRQHN
jgi:hypothetical protein